MAEPLKNLYSTDFITRLASRVKQAYAPFRTQAFIKMVLDHSWEQRELKQRTRHIVLALHEHLPLSYPEQINILKQVAPGFTGYPGVLFPDFVEVFGLEEFSTSIDALEYFTPFSSSEFAVRPFIARYEKEMLRQHKKWATSKNLHVRRLASEGIRPRLPWAMALPAFKKEPSPVIPILEQLKSDPSEYVRRSVANCLNDISKDHPEVVLEIVNRWKGKSKETDWIVKHASRGLLKQGHLAALNTFGLNHAVKATVSNVKLSASRLKRGEALSFEFKVNLEEKHPHDLRIEYRIYFVKANGKTSGKIFQVGTYAVASGQTTEIKRSHKFTDLTTRKHYPGEHRIAVVVNGKELAEASFILV